MPACESNGEAAHSDFPPSCSKSNEIGVDMILRSAFLSASVSSVETQHRAKDADRQRMGFAG